MKTLVTFRHSEVGANYVSVAGCSYFYFSFCIFVLLGIGLFHLTWCSCYSLRILCVSVRWAVLFSLHSRLQ